MKKRVAVLLLFLCGFGFAAGCAKGEKTVTSYVEEHREIFSEMQASMAEGMTLEVSARGNSLAYVYQYTALTDAQEIEKLCSAMEKVWERRARAQGSCWRRFVQRFRQRNRSSLNIWTEQET